MDNVTITDLYYTYEITLNDGVLVYFDEEGEKHFFNIEEIVFHAPSEHTFDGENYDLEMQIIHEDFENEELAIVSVFFDVEKGGEEENSFIDELELTTVRKTNSWNISISLTELLDELD